MFCLTRGPGRYGPQRFTPRSTARPVWSLGDFIGGHTSANILDAATSNGATAGGVSVNPNGTPPTDGTGVFKSPVPLQSVPGGSAETAIVAADVDGNGIAISWQRTRARSSIDIWLNPSKGASANLALLPGGDDPDRCGRGQVQGPASNPDIAVLNSNGTIVIFQNGDHGRNPVTAATSPYRRSPQWPALSSMTSGAVSGNANLPDLIVTTNNVSARMT